MPVIKFIIILLLSFIAFKTESVIGYSFISISILYYLVNIVKWFKNLTKDKDGNYVIHY